ncbi:hypothetical protein D5F01_LYC18903 [Larimichthys crocea]|uniref:THAP domain-containing protein 1 n=1 Tax=Larimichthys crocea TaxID=215358 RepID=A0A6G0HWE2_LARCR|nr:hypothetical protein D5F01_LYC18903 [Larimichthys crocea]
MGRYKCAYKCENSENDSDVKFFKFPLYNPRKLKKWLNNMKWKDWTPSRFSVLCIDHFEEQYIDRTGKCVKLRENAVPTIFSSTDDAQKRKVSINPKSKRDKPSSVKLSQMTPAQAPVTSPATVKRSIQNKEPSQTEVPAGDKDPKKVDKWRIIVDEGLMKIESFPHFFHGDYCVPQDIQWAPDDDVSAECEDPENMIEVKESWQWLGLDVRGPLPQTLNGHKYVLTVTDYYSKILSRLPHDIVHKINRELKDQLKVTVALVVHHQQTGSVDLITQQLIDRMVSDLIEEHAADWDVYLPAKVFSLCFKEHSKTKERPFSMLCCKGLEPVQSPRGLNYTYSKIRESAFVVR